MERARLTKLLAHLKVQAGQLKEASDVLFELQVETFASMARSEQVDYLLDQMQLALALQDTQRAQLVSRKVDTKVLQDPALQAQRQTFYRMMVQMARLEASHLQAAKYAGAMYEGASDAADKVQLLKSMVLFTVLAPYDLEQSESMHLRAADPLLASLPPYRHAHTRARARADTGPLD